MKEIDISTGMYASHHSLTDFYEGSKAKLMDALNSGEDFETEWFGCKKEIRYARICRENGSVSVEVSCHMDDLYESDDLIYDALWEECHTEEELPEDVIDSIRDAACDSYLNDESGAEETLPQDASYEDICECLSRLEDEAERENTEMYNILRAIVKAHYEYMKGESAK